MVLDAIGWSETEAASVAVRSELLVKSSGAAGIVERKERS